MIIATIDIGKYNHNRIYDYKEKLRVLCKFSQTVCKGLWCGGFERVG